MARCLQATYTVRYRDSEGFVTCGALTPAPLQVLEAGYRCRLHHSGHHIPSARDLFSRLPTRSRHPIIQKPATPNGAPGNAVGACLEALSHRPGVPELFRSAQKAIRFTSLPW